MIKLATLAAILLAAIGLIGLSPAYAAMQQPIQPQQGPQAAQDICLARWVWNEDDPTDPFWEAPFSALGGLDLRTRPQRIAKGGIPGGWGLFTYDQPMGATGMHCLGNDLDAPMTTPQVNTIADLIGLASDSLHANTMRGVIAEILIDQADPTGNSRWKPIQITRQGASIVLPGYGEIYHEPYSENSKAMQNTLDVRWADYRRNRARGLPMPMLQKWTGADSRRLFGREPTADDLARLLPPEYRNDGSQRPTTTLTDTFTDTASTALDSHTPTPSGGFTWATPTNGFTVNGSNQITPDADSDNTGRTSASLSSADHYTQVDVTVNDAGGRNYAGPAVRYAAAAETFYMFRIHVNAGSWANQIRRTEAGSSTVILSSTTTNYDATTVTAKLDISGSTLDALVNGSSLGIGGTDTVITGNLQVGITGRQNNNTLDNFEASDGITAARRVIRIS